MPRLATISTTGISSTMPTSKKIGRPITEAMSTIAHGIARPPALARIVSTTWSAPPESVSSLPSVAPSAISTPVLATVEPSPVVKLVSTLSSGAPAAAPSASDPMVSARKACSLNLVMSRTITTMPTRAAMPNWACPEEVIGGGASAASISTLSLVTGVPCGYRGLGRVLRGCGGQPGQRLNGAFGDLLGVSADVHGDTRLVRPQGFQRGELGVQQRGRHEVPLTLPHPVLDQLPVAREVHEHHSGRHGPQPVAVRPLQRRAADHPAEPGPAVRPVADGVQPGPAVGVLERDPGRHLVDVGLRVEVVALGVRHAQSRGEQRTDRGLARPRDAHHDDDLGGSHYCLAVFLDIRRHGGVATLKPIRYDEFKRL
ncbi:hypothetical protein SGPA1_20129 [Streptomyces misionensis JCM 4497]